MPSKSGKSGAANQPETTGSSFDREGAVEGRQEMRAENARLIQENVDRYLKDEVLIQKKAKTVAVLFADLIDSTEFKWQHTEMEWLAKTRLHNLVAEECVVQYGGRVVKFLGDGVMAEFEGTEHAQRAIQSGLAIIEAIETQNETRNHVGMKVLETAVGVASGKVFRFKFPQSKETDPQGTIVDLASRLCGLAGPQQLVCSKTCFDDAGGESVFPNCSKELERFVKGFNGPASMHLVLPEGRSCKDVQLVGHRRKTRPENVDLLKRAQESLDHKEIPKAKRAFEQLVKKEPGNFKGNFRLAELLLGRRPGKGETRAQNVEKAIRHLRAARQINPDSWRVWFMASLARRIKFEGSGDYVDLEWAIKHAYDAVEKAEAFMDRDGANRTKLELAKLHLMKSEDPDVDQSEELSAAAVLCIEIENAFNGLQKRRLSDCLVTTALVLLAQGDTSHVRIKDMLERALEADKDNPNALQAMGKFQKNNEDTDAGISSDFD